MPSIQLLRYFLVAVATLSIATADLHSSPQHPLSLDLDTVGKSPLLSLHRALVEIESFSGNEHGVAEYLYSYLSARNHTVEKQHVKPLATSNDDPPIVRFNLLAYSESKRKTRLLLSSHIDTVPPYWPYEHRKHDQIWGRGSVDAKACVATQIQAVAELSEAGEIKAGDVAFLFVVGEEIGGDGARRANDLGLEWETVIFGEPTELKLASGHKGNLGFNIKATGKAGHSGYPWLGENANSMLIPALTALDKMQLPSSAKYGNTTLNIGKMEGGVAGNVIAETAKAQIQIRIADGSAENIKKIVLDTIKAVDDRLEIEFLSAGYGPIDIDHDVEGFETITVNYGTDIPNLHGSHKKYLYGPGNILVAHSDHEHLFSSDLFAAVDGYKRLIRAALARSP